MNFNIFELLKKINLNNIVSNTNKTLGIVKKSIPVYRQIKPYVTHEKSIFKKNNNLDIIKESNINQDNKYNDTLTFFK